jgi:Amidohydrolase family
MGLRPFLRNFRRPSYSLPDLMKTPQSWRHSLGILLLVLNFTVAHAALAAAELVVRRANVISVDANQPRAQAFAVVDGKFVSVGSDESVQRFIGANTRVLDLAGKTVVPGFIDAHAHPEGRLAGMRSLEWRPGDRNGVERI